MSRSGKDAVAPHSSSTLAIPSTGDIPRHVAIILDGNGRWATERRLPRAAGHKRGLDAVKATVESCLNAGVEFLTLFAFSSENWRRPADEVSLLMRLFVTALEREAKLMRDRGVRLRVVGDRTQFDRHLQELMDYAERITAHNTALTLTIAANYGGRWDILQATQAVLAERASRAGQGDATALSAPVTEDELARHLALSYAPEPELFIRTGSEQRISNFLLWHLAYTELYFCDEYWPEFDERLLQRSFEWFRQRERRFGRTSDQLVEPTNHPPLKSD